MTEGVLLPQRRYSIREAEKAEILGLILWKANMVVLNLKSRTEKNWGLSLWVFLSEFSRCISALTNQPGLGLASGWLGAVGVECCVCPWQSVCVLLSQDRGEWDISGLHCSLRSQLSSALGCLCWSLLGLCHGDWAQAPSALYIQV